jgi:peptidoglycan/xylan/chitin deacetylase (PgdA/CDA1 family)
LSWEELLRIREEGHRIGCHGHAHLPLSRIPFDRAVEDIRHAKALLEDRLGQPVRDFSFPFGMRRFFNRRLRLFCRDQGFETISTGIPGLQHGVRDPLNLHRSPWNFLAPFELNLEALKVDGRLFHALTGRSAVG